MTKKMFTKIIATGVAAALIASCSVAAFADDNTVLLTSTSTTESTEAIDWASLEDETETLLDMLTESEKTEIADKIADFDDYVTALEALEEDDMAVALYYTVLYNGATEIVVGSYSGNSVVSNTYLSAYATYQTAMAAMENASDYTILNQLIDYLYSVDVTTASTSALSGTLTDDEFEELLDMVELMDGFSDTFSAVFMDIYDKIVGILDNDITNNASVQSTVALYETRYGDILAKSLDELTEDDLEEIENAITAYEALSVANQYALSDYYDMLLTMRDTVNALEDDAEDEDDTETETEEETETETEEEEEETVSDSDLTVSDSDLTVSGSDVVSDSDADSDAVDTGDSNTVAPAIAVMISSVLGCLGMALKIKGFIGI